MRSWPAHSKAERRQTGAVALPSFPSVQPTRRTFGDWGEVRERRFGRYAGCRVPLALPVLQRITACRHAHQRQKFPGWRNSIGPAVPLHRSLRLCRCLLCKDSIFS